MAWTSMAMCQVETLVGRGDFGPIYRARKLMDRKLCAIKVIENDNEDHQTSFETLGNDARNHYAVAIAMNHPNIIRIFGQFEEDGKLHQVMEFCETDMQKEIQMARVLGVKQYFSEEKLYNWAKQMASALQYLHESGIRHGDIKPQNFLLSGPNKDVRLSNFGTSRPMDIFNTTNTGELMGTVMYMSPEAMDSKPLSDKCDVWGFGCTFYELVCLEPLFDGTNMLSIVYEIIQFTKPVSIARASQIAEANLKQDVVDFLDYCIVNDAKQRPSINRVLEHHFLGDLPRLFISYSRKNTELVFKVKDRLLAWGFKVWIDDQNMHGNLTDAMAEGIENASIVLICYSEDYARSRNCKLEADYCLQLDKAFVPCRMQPGYKPKGWLGICLGSKLFFDFTKEDRFDSTIGKLVDELRHIGRFPKTSDLHSAKQPHNMIVGEPMEIPTEKRPVSRKSSHAASPHQHLSDDEELEHFGGSLSPPSSRKRFAERQVIGFLNGSKSQKLGSNPKMLVASKLAQAMFQARDKVQLRQLEPLQLRKSFPIQQQQHQNGQTKLAPIEAPHLSRKNIYRSYDEFGRIVKVNK